MDLPLDRKREILAREALLGRDDWTVLGLKPGASAEAVKAAYFEASKVFHPDRYYGKNLGSFGARLDRIFQRLSEAHEKLITALRRSPPPPTAGSNAPRRSATGGKAAADPRAEERRARLARHPYLARGGQASALVEEAQRALRTAPDKALRMLEKAKSLGGAVARERASGLENEAKQQLGSQRAAEQMRAGEAAAQKGDASGAAQAYGRAATLDPARADAAYEAARWGLKVGGLLVEARNHAQHAVSLRPDHLPSHLLLAEICIRMGMGSVARRHLDAVLKLDPRNAQAKALLRQVR